MKVNGKDVVIFLGGLGTGITAGALIAHEVTKRKMEKEHEEEIVEIRELYKGATTKKPKSLEKREIESVESVGSGIPKEKKVDTRKTDYTQPYKNAGAKHVLTEEQKARIKAVQSQGPSDDDDKDYGIYEITEEYDEINDEPGFGDKKFQDWMEMTFYTHDEALQVTSWGSWEDAELERTSEQVINDESELVHDILPVLAQMDFLNKPYDIMYIRNNLRGVDVKVIKRYEHSPIVT